MGAENRPRPAAHEARARAYACVYRVCVWCVRVCVLVCVCVRACAPADHLVVTHVVQAAEDVPRRLGRACV